MPKWTITGTRTMEVEREMDFEVTAPTWAKAKEMWYDNCSDREYSKETAYWDPLWHTEQDDGNNDRLEQPWDVVCVVNEQGIYCDPITGDARGQS